MGARLVGHEKESLEGRRLHELIACPAERVDLWLRKWASTRALLPVSLPIADPDHGVVERAAQGGLLDPQGDSGAPLLILRLRDRSTAIRQFSELNQRIVDLKNEISRRSRAEAILQGERQVLELIGRSSPLPESLAAIVGLVETWTDAIGSILLLEGDERMRHGAGPNLSEVYRQAIDGLTIGPSIGSCGTAMFRKAPVEVSDIATDPLWRDFKDLALAEGFRACWSYPIVSAGGAILGSVAMYHRTKLDPRPYDRELTSIACRLASIAIERDRSERELREHAAELEDADRRKDEFLALLGHELRNPLSPILTSLEALERQPTLLDETLPSMQRQARHLRRIIDDLLDVSRIKRGKIELCRQHVDAVALARQLTEAYALQAESADLRLLFRSEIDEAWVHADADRLHQALGNLLVNSIRYTPGGGRVEVCCSLAESRVEIAVADTGIGIPSQLLPRVFDAFVQGEQPLSRQNSGLGIGLTLVRELIARHQGQVSVRSEGVGQGSEFRVSLPLVTPPSHRTEPAEISRSALDGLSILVVDDYPESAAGLAQVLELEGLTCFIAETGPEALIMAERHGPRAIVLDIGLPGIDGYEVSRTLRSRSGFGKGECLLIALTGYGAPSDSARAMEAGFDVFLSKPVDVDRLLEILAERLPQLASPRGSEDRAS